MCDFEHFRLTGKISIPNSQTVVKWLNTSRACKLAMVSMSAVPSEWFVIAKMVWVCYFNQILTLWIMTQIMLLYLLGAIEVKGGNARSLNATRINMICGGSGLTPMYQVLKHILSSSSDNTKVSLVFANRVSVLLASFSSLMEQNLTVDWSFRPIGTFSCVRSSINLAERMLVSFAFGTLLKAHHQVSIQPQSLTRGDISRPYLLCEPMQLATDAICDLRAVCH